MKTLYHGTTKENFESILDKRFGSRQSPNDKTWKCSQHDTTYFYDTEAEEFEDSPELALQYAFESAQITAAVQDYRGDSLVVIEVEIEEECTEPDLSASNMDCLAVEVKNNDLNRYGEIKRIHTAKWDIIMKPFVLLNVMGMEHINLDLNPIEQRIMESIQGKDIFIDELLHFEHETKTLNSV